MHRNILFRVAIYIILCVLVPEVASSQGVVKRSETKVSIGGVGYYVHIVDSAQTLYSISKAYNVPVEVITKENPSALYGLRTGQALKIPVAAADNDTSQAEKDTEKYIYHILQPGETIYALSKKYDLPEDDIADANPGIDIYDLPVGKEIAIPKKVFNEQTEYFQTGNDSINLHKVERGENFSSIARKYGITARELRDANKRVIFLRAGDYIRIPGREQAETAVEEVPVEEETKLTDDEKITYLFDGTVTDYTPVENLDGSVKVSLLLPLYLDENSARTYIDSSEIQDGDKIYKIVKRPQDWIYPRSELFVEFYEGALLAIDKLREKGLNVDLSVYDTGPDSLKVSDLIASGQLRNSDLIIGPVYTYNVEQVANYARTYRIPVVSPLAPRNPEVLSGNPYLFKVQPSLDIVQEEIATKVSDFYDHNIVLVHSDTAWSRSLDSDFKSKIYRELRYRVPYDNIHLREVFFASRSNFNDTINIIEHALSRDMPNIVIVASEDMAVMSEVLVNIHTLLRNYDIKVIGYPEMRWLDNLDPGYFYDLEVMLFTPNWVDYSQDDVKEFIEEYRDKFNMEPPLRSYAWQSYDITYYFLSGIALEGDDFKYRPGSHHPNLLQVDYNFKRYNIFSGYENTSLYLIRYRNDLKVEFLH